MFLRLPVVNCALPPSEAPEFGAWHGKRFRKPIHPPVRQNPWRMQGRALSTPSSRCVLLAGDDRCSLEYA